MRHEQQSTQVGTPNDYMYNGKELADDFGLNWYFYGFRMYDPATGRFPSIDPIAEQFAFVSPYNYAENEPIANIDLHGLQKVNFMHADIIAADKGGGDIVEKYGNQHDAGTLFNDVPDKEFAIAAATGVSLAVPDPTDIAIGAVVGTKIVQATVQIGVKGLSKLGGGLKKLWNWGKSALRKVDDIDVPSYMSKSQYKSMLNAGEEVSSVLGKESQSSLLKDVGNDNLEEILKELSGKEFSDKTTSIISNLSKQLDKNNMENVKGVINYENSTLKRNQIRDQIIQIISPIK